MKKKVGEHILVPLKGVFLNADGSKQSGFKNAIVTGILLEVTDDGALMLGNTEGQLLTIVPRESVGVILTDGSSFYQGSDTDEFDALMEMMEDPDGSLN